MKRVNTNRQRQGVGESKTAVSGPEYYGLAYPEIKRLIQVRSLLALQILTLLVQELCQRRCMCLVICCNAVDVLLMSSYCCVCVLILKRRIQEIRLLALLVQKYKY
jgi:hypothetical protein